MPKFEIRNGARLAAAAGLGLTLALGAAPVVAMAAEQPVEAASTGAVETDVTENAPEQEGGVAQIGDNQYESLEAAIEAAQDGVKTTIVLTKSFVVSTDGIVTIPVEKDIVLDMAGHSITVTEGFVGRPIVNNGTLCVVGEGTIDSSASQTGYGAINNFGNLTIENGTFSGNVQAGGSCIRNTGSSSFLTVNGGTFDKATCMIYNEGTATLNDGTYTGRSCSSCYPESWAYTVQNHLADGSSINPTMTINGGTYSGVQGVISSSIGSLVVNNGDFNAVKCDNNHDPFYTLYVAGEDGKASAEINGGTFTNAGSRPVAYVANDNEGGDGGINEEAYIKFSGGTFIAAQRDGIAVHVEKLGSLSIEGGTYQGKLDSEATTGFVSGGSFSVPVEEKYCANGFKPVTTPNADGQYVVAQAKGVVKIGEQAFDSVSAALGSIESSEDKTATITLQADVYENVTIPEGCDVTLDLNGFTLTNDASSNDEHTITNEGTLTIVDGSQDKTGTVDNVSHGRAALFNAEGAVADVCAGTLERSCEAGSGPGESGGNSYYTVLNQGTMTLGAGAVVESKLTNGSYSSYSSVIANGWQTSEPTSGTSTAKLVIDGARVEGGLYVKNDRYGVLEMKDGYVKGTSAGIFNYATATISGGTVEAALENRGAVWNYEEPSYEKDEAPAKLTVTGGTLNADEGQFAIRQTNAGEDGSATRGTVEISGGNINGRIGTGAEGATLSADQFEITGGTFTSNPVELMDEDDNSAVKLDGDSFTVLSRGNLPAGTYVVPDGADDLTAKDFLPGLSITVDKDGTVVATKPSTPAPSGDAVKVEQSEGGKVSVTPTRADKGDTVTIAATPDEGQEVCEVTVTDSKGNEVEVKQGEKDGEWTFEMPDGEVTVSVEFGCDGGELCPTHSFTDVDQSAWYHDAVDWAVAEGVLNGYGEGGESLGPVADVTRAEMAQMLWNRAGRPGADADLSEFTDVDAGGWYAPALEWCVSEGIFSGYGDTFGTERTISREEAVTVLWRLSGSPEADADLSGYGDASKVSDYATGAIEWAVSEGVLTGKGGVALDPQAGCTRGEVAAMMMRMAQ